jgi:hypothetical protein
MMNRKKLFATQMERKLLRDSFLWLGGLSGIKTLRRDESLYETDTLAVWCSGRFWFEADFLQSPRAT